LGAYQPVETYVTNLAGGEFFESHFEFTTTTIRLLHLRLPTAHIHQIATRFPREKIIAAK